MLRELRKNIIHLLWQNYRKTSPQIKKIEARLKEKGMNEFFLDHFAIIDLPGPHTGIPHLSEIFKALGYIVKGNDYLAEKQNDFCWMSEKESEQAFAKEALPQAVVADFRLDALPPEIRKIVLYYANFAPYPPIASLQTLIKRMQDNASVISDINKLITLYFAGRDWPLPTVKEFYTVKEFNDLLAWVLVFGRKPNHFTLSVHLLDRFENLLDFVQFITNEVKLNLNTEGGIIKGNETVGIAQGSTLADTQMISLQDGDIPLSTSFVEFVWRYPRFAHPPERVSDYFTGFVANQANHVIESLY